MKGQYRQREASTRSNKQLFRTSNVASFVSHHLSLTYKRTILPTLKVFFCFIRNTEECQVENNRRMLHTCCAREEFRYSAGRSLSAAILCCCFAFAADAEGVLAGEFCAEEGWESFGPYSS